MLGLLHIHHSARNIVGAFDISICSAYIGQRIERALVVGRTNACRPTQQGTPVRIRDGPAAVTEHVQVWQVSLAIAERGYC